jgi:hypothetical protein
MKMKDRKQKMQDALVEEAFRDYLADSERLQEMTDERSLKVLAEETSQLSADEVRDLSKLATAGKLKELVYLVDDLIETAVEYERENAEPSFDYNDLD